jgi:nucleoside-diphosphate-sugar epimerase
VIGTRNVARAALARRARRMIHTSSIAAFGLLAGEITEETQSSAERSPIGYLRTKYLAELEVRAAIEAGLDAVILNPANIVGPYDLLNWSRSFRLVAEGRLPGIPPGGGAFCHVERVVEAHIASVERGRTGERYILAGVNASYLEMFTAIGRLLGRSVPRKTVPPLLLQIVARLFDWRSRLTGREPDVTPDLVTALCARYSCSSAKAERELGYDGAQSLEGMLADCHAWMVREGMLPARG